MGNGFVGNGFRGNGLVGNGFVGNGFARNGFPGSGFVGNGFLGSGFAGGVFNGGGFNGGNVVTPNIGPNGNINSTVLVPGSYGGYGAAPVAGGVLLGRGAGTFTRGVSANPGNAVLPRVYYPSSVPGAY